MENLIHDYSLIQTGNIFLHTNSKGITRLTYVEPSEDDYHMALPIMVLKRITGNAPKDERMTIVMDEDTIRYVLSNLDRGKKWRIDVGKDAITIVALSVEFTFTEYIIIPSILLARLSQDIVKLTDMIFTSDIEAQSSVKIEDIVDDEEAITTMYYMCGIYIEALDEYLGIYNADLHVANFNLDMNPYLNKTPIEISDKYMDLYGYTRFDYTMFDSDRYLDILAIIAAEYRYYTPTKDSRVYTVDIGDLDKLIPQKRLNKQYKLKNVLFKIRGLEESIGV